jgi:hypothetical protein
MYLNSYNVILYSFIVHTLCTLKIPFFNKIITYKKKYIYMYDPSLTKRPRVTPLTIGKEPRKCTAGKLLDKQASKQFKNELELQF